MKTANGNNAKNKDTQGQNQTSIIISRAVDDVPYCVGKSMKNMDLANIVSRKSANVNEALSRPKVTWADVVRKKAIEDEDYKNKGNEMKKSAKAGGVLSSLSLKHSRPQTSRNKVN